MSFADERCTSYYRARYYDPQVGRFISEDPIGFEAGDNYYTYAGNDPTDLSDPAGLSPDWWDWLMGKLGTGSSAGAGAAKSNCPVKCDADGYRNVTAEEGNRLLQEALKHRGKPYGGKGPNTFDCSGLVCYSIQHSLDSKFPDLNTGGLGKQQAGLYALGSQDSPQAGDLQLFSGHVGFYDPNPPKNLAGQTVFSARGNFLRDKDKKIIGVDPASHGVDWGDPKWYGKSKFYRLRIRCSK